VYLDGTLRDFVSQAAAAKPTPGGGSVSALAGALAASMGEMAAGYTRGRRRYAEAQAEVEGILADLERRRLALLDLVETDAEAYGQVDRAMAMPRDGADSQQARRQALDAALRAALEPPLDVMRHCAEVAEAARRLAEVGNRNLISDAGVGAILAEAACAGAGLNVDANLEYIGDEALSRIVREETADLTARCVKARESALRLVAADPKT
jgi:formiminotetrahydrofolate cyclodeaminase